MEIDVLWLLRPLKRAYYHWLALTNECYVEVNRGDVAIPPLCASCGSKDAPFHWPTREVIIEYGTLLELEVRKRFLFQYCLGCHRKLQRLRRLGNMSLVLAFSAIALIPVSIVVVANFAAARRLVNAGPSDWLLYLWLAFILFAVAAIPAGIWLYNASPDVWIIDTPGDSFFFRFHNRKVRDKFLRMNESER